MNLHPLACCPIAALAAAVLGAGWIAAQPTSEPQSLVRLATPAPPASDASSMATTLHGEAARSRAAAPGRAPLLRSPFAPMPVASSDEAAAPPQVTPAQALALDVDLAGDVIRIRLDCCSRDDDVELARGIVHGEIAARNLAPDAPVLIESDARAFATRLAERLVRDGLTRVLVLKPAATQEAP